MDTFDVIVDYVTTMFGPWTGLAFAPIVFGGLGVSWWLSRDEGGEK